jgi:hypothetical protein
MLNDAMAPQSYLPSLKAGQTWTVVVYSPLNPQERISEILHAKVERKTVLSIGDRIFSTWVVVFRSDPGSAAGEGIERAKLWVTEDGAVVKQELSFLGFQFAFARLDLEASVRRARQAKLAHREWNASGHPSSPQAPPKLPY